jgi:Methyltransferase small domain
MPVEAQTIPDLLQQSREVCGDVVVYRFANGLTIKTEVFSRSDRLRILPLGTAQASLMNHMLNHPHGVRGRHVFEPFAGSGALGFMALKAGATEVDFLDINPRASEFQRENAALNQMGASQFTSITGDIAHFAPLRMYDLIIANPPFVPTPPGIDGTITSNGGPDGNRFVDILLQRLEEFLEPSGRALIYVFQFAVHGQPLIVDLVARTVTNRPVEITPSQSRPLPFETYCKAYALLFTTAGPAIDQWRSDIVGRHGTGLTLCHYVVDIGPRSRAPTRCTLRDNFAEKFGETFLVPSHSDEELALGRALENFVADGIA